MTNQKQSAADIAEGHELNRQLWDVINNMLDEPYLVPVKAILIKIADMHRQAINASVYWLQKNGEDKEIAGEDRRLSKPSLQVRDEGNEATRRQDIIAMLGEASGYSLDPRWASLDLKSLEHELYNLSSQALNEYYCPGEGTYSPATGMCTYLYDRERAVEYMRHYAVRGNWNPAFVPTTQQGGDCANYVSQGLHYGGLPMIAYEPDGQPGGVGAEREWACFLGSYGWWGEMGWRSTDYLKANLETYFGFEEVETAEPIIGEVPLGQTPALSGVRAGDVLNIPGRHVAMVIGWGPAFATWDEFNAATGYPTYRSWDEYNNVTREAFGDGITPDDWVLRSFVPYVIDHGTQSNTARPYYLLRWSMSNSYEESSEDYYHIDRRERSETEWEFWMMPDVIEIPPGDILEPIPFEDD